MSKILDEILNQEEINVFVQENAVLDPLSEEINLIQDQAIRYFVRSILLRAGVFWHIPASFSGEHHPPDERGLGGNVLHTKRVARCAYWLARAYELNPLDYDIVIAASLLHDLTKGVQWSRDTPPAYDPMHPYTVDKFVRFIISDDKKHAGENQSSTLMIDTVTLEKILRAVRCHMGTWSPIPETTPTTEIEHIVHLADYFCSKMHLIIDGDDVQEWRWQEQPEEK